LCAARWRDAANEETDRIGRACNAKFYFASAHGKDEFMKMVLIKTTINGKQYDLEVRPNMTLLDLLRDELGFTGTKRGCEVGECGACTVLMNDQAVNSCLVLAPQVQGKEILTVEGLADGEKLHPLQESFLDHDAVHCGFCTPGMLMSAKELIDQSPKPSESEVRTAISGNLCRCSGYQQIVDAIKEVGEAKRGGNSK
jgi:aerobic carbon-monoxide dehydrogenase small subunit